MATYNTGNALGSADPRDLLDNSQIADHYVNDTENSTWQDRFGNARKTWKGIENDAAEAIHNIGWQEVGDWAIGIVITARPQIVLYNGDWYKYLGELNHTISGDSPSNDGGIWSSENPSGVWGNIGDSALRSELAKPAGNLLIGGITRVFNICDYGAVADYDLSTKTIGTDSTDAINKAVAAAKLVNGIVYAPYCPNGKAYYKKGYTALHNSYYSGAIIQGDGIRASIIVCDPGAGEYAFGALTSSGRPVNSNISDVWLMPHVPGQGMGLLINNWTFVSPPNLAIGADADEEGFEVGLTLLNNGSVALTSFTEFINFGMLWTKNNGINVRLVKGDNGDPSFHGCGWDNWVSNNLTGQTGLQIGAGCNLYNSASKRLSFFGPAGCTYIQNLGSWSGFANLYFEGYGQLDNQGGTSLAGDFRIQNTTGKIADISSVPFMHDKYISPVTLSDSNFSVAGFSSVDAMEKQAYGQMFRRIFRLRGTKAEAHAICGYDSGNFRSQGLAIVSQTEGDGLADITLRSLHHLQGIDSYVPSFGLAYMQNTPQLRITSENRHHGSMGTRVTGTIAASSSAQTITLSSVILPAVEQPCLMTIRLYSSDQSVKHLASYAICPVNGTPSSAGNAIAFYSEGLTAAPSAVGVNSTGKPVFTLTTSVALTFEINILGIGDY